MEEINSALSSCDKSVSDLVDTPINAKFLLVFSTT
jgi:hypothetical protein